MEAMNYSNITFLNESYIKVKELFNFIACIIIVSYVTFIIIVILQLGHNCISCPKINFVHIYFSKLKI